MSSKDEFYIGYQDQAPEGQQRFIKKWVMILLGIVAVVALLFSVGQTPFVDSKFDLGKVTEIEGVFYKSPYPMLKVETEEGVKDIMLVGFGKFGADHSRDSEPDHPEEGSVLSLEGNMIWYDHKVLFQLLPNLDGKYNRTGSENPSKNIIEKGQVELQGEIVDPKCYFGVMKPGFGKIHRSCATRCLSGGIPPVMVTTMEDSSHEYYVLTDKEGKKLGREILPYVGKPSQVSGEVSRFGDWNYIKIDPAEIEILAIESKIYR